MDFYQGDARDLYAALQPNLGAYTLRSPLLAVRIWSFQSIDSMVLSVPGLTKADQWICHCQFVGGSGPISVSVLHRQEINVLATLKFRMCCFAVLLKQELLRHCVYVLLAEMEQNAAIEVKVYDAKVKREILSPTVGVINDGKVSEEKYHRACEIRDEYKFRYTHFKQLYEKILKEKEALLKESANKPIPQTEVWALKAQVESLQDELKGYKTKVEEYKILFENSCTEKEEIIRKSLEKVEQRALEAQVASLQDQLQAYAECRLKLQQQEDLYKKTLIENKLLKTNSNEFRALELQVASLQDELTHSKGQYAELSKRYAEKEKQFSGLEVKRCPACRASCSPNERQRVKNELTEGVVQEQVVSEEFRKKQNELVVQLESQTNLLKSSQERCIELEAKVKEDQVELDKLRNEVDRLMKECSSLKPVEVDMLKEDHSTRKQVVHKIVSKEEEGKLKEDQVELDELKEEVDKLMKESPSLKSVEVEMLNEDHSTRKPVVHKIVSREEEGKDHVECDEQREEVDKLMKESPSPKSVEMEILKEDHSTGKPVVHKIVSREEVGKVKEDEVEIDDLRNEVDKLVMESPNLKSVEMELLKEDHSTKPVVNKIVSRKEEGKGKHNIRKRKTTDEKVAAQDVRKSEPRAPPSPLCEAGLKKERNLRKRVRNQCDKVVELAQNLKTLNLKPEKIDKAKTKRAPRPRKKKVQDENDPTFIPKKSPQVEAKVPRNTRSQKKKTVSAVGKVDTSAASAATRSQRV